MAITLDGTNGITTPNETVTGNISAATYNNGQLAGNRNKIINGAMMIDQRNAGASVTANTASSFVYTLDRWSYYAGQTNKFTVQQSSTAPVGFTTSLKITSSSAYTVAAGDIFAITQPIEGVNCSDLAWGTANAKTVTLSFQVYSSLTGTFAGSILNSSGVRSYPFTYTISAANTWTQISAVIPGDTTGTWLTDTNRGMYVAFALGVGSTYSGTANTWAGSQYWSVTGATSVVGTNGATFYITGVQLEKGATATPFENRLYGTELALCYRYYQQIVAYTVSAVLTLNNINYINRCCLATMRTAPTVTSTGTWGNASPSAVLATTNTYRWEFSGGASYSNATVTEILNAEL